MKNLQSGSEAEEALEAEIDEILERMEKTVRASLPGAGALLDRASPGSPERQELMADLMRGSTGKFPSKDILNLLRSLREWEILNPTEKDVIAPGEFLGNVKIEGETWPCSVFGAVAMLFDDDPLLACMAQAIRNDTGRGLLLHVYPLFHFVPARDGSVDRFVLFGGWIVDDAGCHPFCIEPGGTDRLLEQVRYFRSPRVSRGFLRDRGHGGRQLDIVNSTQMAIDKVISRQREELAEGLSADEAATVPGILKSFERSDYTVTYDRNNWCFFTHKNTATHLKEAQDMLADMDFLVE